MGSHKLLSFAIGEGCFVTCLVILLFGVGVYFAYRSYDVTALGEIYELDTLGWLVPVPGPWPAACVL